MHPQPLRNDFKRLGCALHYIAAAAPWIWTSTKPAQRFSPLPLFSARATRRNDFPAGDSGDFAALNHDDGSGISSKGVMAAVAWMAIAASMPDYPT